MKKKIILFIALFTLILIPSKVKAASCDFNDIGDMYVIASNIKVSYQYTIVDNKIAYDITFTNLTRNMKMLSDMNTQIYYGFVNGKDFTIRVYEGGKYNFDIYYGNCGTKLISKSIVLPSYNEYHVDSRCEGLEEYAVCNRWSGYNKSSDEFEEDLKKAKYDYEKKNVQKKEPSKKELTVFEKIIKFLAKYMFIIIGVLLIILLIGTKIYENYKKKHEFDFNL